MTIAGGLSGRVPAFTWLQAATEHRTDCTGADGLVARCGVQIQTLEPASPIRSMAREYPMHREGTGASTA